ncbi:MAG: ABC transporter substrate-binding protein [Alphaproteobacteria bacterium]|nr:ABC transporter substrate-binding protein [Alphaproteobacteria bacterium]
MPEYSSRTQHQYLPELKEQLRKGEIDRREFLRTAVLLGVSTAGAYALAGEVLNQSVVRVARAQSAQPRMGGNLRVGMSVMDITDPAKYDWPPKANVARQIIEPLVQIGLDNVARPHLAESWKPSADLKTWEFKLRRGIKWSNGDECNADDLIFNVTRWLDPATASSNQSRLRAMTVTTDTGRVNDRGQPIRRTSMAEGSIEKIDSHTVRFHLQTPDLAIPEALSDYPALLVHRRFADMGGDLRKNPIGTGPYRLVEHTVGQRSVLAKRPKADYWGDEVYLDQITYVDLGEDPAAMIAALASNQVDMNHQFSADAIEAIQRIPHLQLNEVGTSATGVARMRITEKPFDDKRVREAIRLCVDHNRLLEIAYRGHGVPAEDHHVAPIHPEYATLSDKLKPDIEKARALIKAAGYDNGLTVTLYTVAGPSWETITSQAIAEMCKPAGINVQVNLMPGATYWDRWLSTPFGFTSWGHRPLGVQALNLAYRTGGIWNESGHSDPEYDKWLQEASATPDPKERQKIMEKLQRRLQENSVISQGYWRSVINATNKRVKNFKIHVALEHHLNKVWLES